MTPCKSEPLVSVLIPVYNCEDYISQCIESALNQDYPNVEIVVYDDGSTDNSPMICEEYAKKHSRITCMKGSNRGVAHARNELLSAIKGEYFIFLDADDWFEPEIISFLFTTIRNHDVDIATCGVKERGGEPVKSQVEIWDRETTIKEFLIHKRINGSLCNKLIKTDLLKENRFSEEIYYGEDALFTWQILKGVRNIAITNKPLYNYRTNPLSLSRQRWTPDRKGSGFKVWKEISDDVKSEYPQYLSIVRSRAALEDMWALYFASQSGYKKDEHIKKRQRYIKQHFSDLRANQLDGRKAYYSAVLLSRWYGAGKLISMINNLRK